MQDGRVALYLAADKGRLDIVNALLLAGADANIQSRMVVRKTLNLLSSIICGSYERSSFCTEMYCTSFIL